MLLGALDIACTVVGKFEKNVIYPYDRMGCNDLGRIFNDVKTVLMI